MNRDQYTLMHILNLDTIGGVETLYMHFLQKVWKRDSVLHVTSISGKRAHPLYHNILAGLRYTPFYERYLLGCFLPKPLLPLAKLRRWMLTDVSKAALMVFWNRIEKSSPGFPFLYYEHGAAWNLPLHPGKMPFFESCQGAICVSEAAKYMLQDKVHPSFPIHVLSNPLRPDLSLAPSPKKAPSGKIQLGFLGRLLPIKAPAIALLTVFELRKNYGMDVHITLGGNGSDKPFLLNLAKQLDLVPFITFIDRVESLENFYDTIDVLLIPSVREPLGLVALEASARGVPIVASCVDGLFESVQDGVSGILIQPTLPIKEGRILSSFDGVPEVVFNPIQKKLVIPQLLSPTDCAQAVARIIQSGLYDTLSRGGLERAAARAPFDSWCSALLALFRESFQHLAAEEEEHEEE